jgi:2-polyprenyl-3-methyl-5-hydroxy-6-metoxy-1,4-benzoquinol methylase
MNKKEFLDAVNLYKLKLDSVNGYDEINKLWKETSLPYVLNCENPNSLDYYNEVKDTYELLTGLKYDISNELTSTKQEGDSFSRGFPWVTNNLDVIASHYAGLTQVFDSMSKYKVQSANEVIEFGSGWFNLAIPLSKIGFNVTAVDIDNGFLSRGSAVAKSENLSIDTINSDFLEVRNKVSKKFDIAIFQSSFHHCLDFDLLLTYLQNDLLNDNGMIFLFSEPINNSYSFPWGLRYDGESLWAIVKNGWLELGFRLDFFSTKVLEKGYFITRISAIKPFIGEGYLLRKSEINFPEWILADVFDDTWHIANKEGVRFSKGSSRLPSLMNSKFKKYGLKIHNFSNFKMTIGVNDASGFDSFRMEPSETRWIEINADKDNITIDGSVYIPNDLTNNGDNRELSFAVSKIKFI